MGSRSRVRLRDRLWPSRRLFEHSQRELTGSVDQGFRGVAGEVADLRETVAGLATDLAAVAAAARGLGAESHELVLVQAELRTRLRRTQALTARTYEAIHDWPGLLAAARADPGFEEAYTDPDPLVSIPIPTYHSPDTLCGRALASVLAQTHTNWEAIVVGDHCTDDTEQRVRALDDPRIRFHNLGARENDPDDPWERWAVKGSVPRATGVALSKGRWIAPLSHDDDWDPDHIETLLRAARAARAEVAYSRMRVVKGEDSARQVIGICGAWPPRLGAFDWQSAIYHGHLRFLRYDRACALASEPNDWNMARRAWEAGVRFDFIDRETPRCSCIRAASRSSPTWRRWGCGRMPSRLHEGRDLRGLDAPCQRARRNDATAGLGRRRGGPQPPGVGRP